MAERTRRSKKEIIADFDSKITYHEKCIATLKQRKDEAMKPKEPRVRKISMSKALAHVKASGLTPDEIVDAIDKKAKSKAKAETKTSE